ncbi:phosphatase PAP2 family protein [Mobilitalea sibirica]|uniref:Phosphatase PAP2 family protein n=1 Tax=Mobilitalea sibirica TaxID=1462919 RepID=A0A8J7KX55_9FIRM|nr:phosphatase PAP2 family protein [Mobilitalea sibirica]MBH1942130.1 phosphatase PAP2 family protein [Mobilitalea sibirica]
MELIQSIDNNILIFIQENLKNPVFDQVMVFITKLGNAGFLWILIAFLLLSQKKYQKCGVPLICAISLAMFFGDDILKPLIGRIRPCNSFPEVPLLISRPNTFSFPSGHTMVGFTSATVIFKYHRKLGGFTFMIASFIAYSRLHLFVHYPSDILGGIVLGMLNAAFVIIGVEAIYNYIDDFH